MNRSNRSLLKIKYTIILVGKSLQIYLIFASSLDLYNDPWNSHLSWYHIKLMKNYILRLRARSSSRIASPSPTPCPGAETP